MCWRPLGPSHVEAAGVDAHQLDQSFEVRQQRVGQWLIRDQLEIPQRESQFEIKRREQKKRLRDLKH
jgi:hypothetical protein